MNLNLESDLLTNYDFTRLSKFIYEQSGIKISDSKKTMVEGRLRKRLKELKINSYSAYCDFLFSCDGIRKEVTNMIDVITTNKTDFFREPKQFDFLTNTALPLLVETHNIGLSRSLRLWSAGCSTGEEPYTLSIVIQEFASKIKNYAYHIVATDISTRVLNAAKYAVYDEEKIEPIAPELIKKYFLRSKDRERKQVRLIPAIRNSIDFQWLNLMDRDFGFTEAFDIIFCRNVMIYFDRPTQEKLIEKLISHLNPGGYLFMGTSESILNKNLPIVQMEASTYQVKSRLFN